MPFAVIVIVGLGAVPPGEDRLAVATRRLDRRRALVDGHGPYPATALPFADMTRSGKFGTPWWRMQDTNLSSWPLRLPDDGAEPEDPVAGAVVVVPICATLADGALPPQAASASERLATPAATDRPSARRPGPAMPPSTELPLGQPIIPT